MIYDGSRCGFDLYIVCVGVWDRWGGASVAWRLGSRGRWCSRGDFLEDFRDVGWGRGVLSLYVIVLYRGVSARFKFQVGLVVGVR